jgi:hypothetical protein
LRPYKPTSDQSYEVSSIGGPELNRILLKTNRSFLRLPEVQVLPCLCGDFLAFSRSLLKSCATSSEDFVAILRRTQSL